VNAVMNFPTLAWEFLSAASVPDRSSFRRTMLRGFIGYDENPFIAARKTLCALHINILLEGRFFDFVHSKNLQKST
jgi:hypothetical protein